LNREGNRWNLRCTPESTPHSTHCCRRSCRISTANVFKFITLRNWWQEPTSLALEGRQKRLGWWWQREGNVSTIQNESIDQFFFVLLAKSTCYFLYSSSGVVTAVNSVLRAYPVHVTDYRLSVAGCHCGGDLCQVFVEQITVAFTRWELDWLFTFPFLFCKHFFFNFMPIWFQLSKRLQRLKRQHR
jgi:hypothetical protein